MATFCAFFLKSDSIGEIVEGIKSFYNPSEYKLRESVGTDLVSLYTRGFPIYRKLPLLAAVRQSYSDYYIVDYNSFKCPTELLKFLSQQLNTAIINLNIQTVSDAYQFKYFTDGAEVRNIAYADGELYENEGDYFDFETDPIGIDQSDEEDSEPWYAFCEESVDDYCKRLGFSGVFENDWDNSGVTLKIKRKNFFEKLFG